MSKIILLSFDVEEFKIPFYIKRNSGDKALKMLEKYIHWCKKKNYKFSTFTNYLKELGRL